MMAQTHHPYSTFSLKPPHRLVLFLILYLLMTQSQALSRSGGVQSTIQKSDLPFTIQHARIDPSVYGKPNLSGRVEEYTMFLTLEKHMPDLYQSAVITSGYQSTANSHLAFNLSSTLVASNTSMGISLFVRNRSSLAWLSFEVIRIGQAFMKGDSYFMMVELSSKGPSQPGYSEISHSADCKVYPLIKDFRITPNYTASLPSFSQGFSTKYQFKKQSLNGTMLQVWFEKQVSTESLYNLEVTWVVLLINPTFYKSTAQFSTLQHIVQKEIATSIESKVVIQNYSSEYNKNLLIGVSSLTKINSKESVLDFKISGSEVTFTTKQHEFVIFQLVDYSCPSEKPYKYKGDSQCYSCTSGIEITMKENNFTEYNSFLESNSRMCKKIETRNTGYKFEEKTGEILSICGYCKQCYPEYFVEEGKCVSCQKYIENCEQCGSQSTCTKCSTGFRLKQLGEGENKTISCEQFIEPIICGEGCDQCDSEGSCIACKSGFKLVQSKEQRQNGIRKAQPFWECIKSASLYYLDPSEEVEPVHQESNLIFSNLSLIIVGSFLLVILIVLLIRCFCYQTLFPSDTHNKLNVNRQEFSQSQLQFEKNGATKMRPLKDYPNESKLSKNQIKKNQIDRALSQYYQSSHVECGRSYSDKGKSSNYQGKKQSSLSGKNSSKGISQQSNSRRSKISKLNYQRKKQPTKKGLKSTGQRKITCNCNQNRCIESSSCGCINRGQYCSDNCRCVNCTNREVRGYMRQQRGAIQILGSEGQNCQTPVGNQEFFYSVVFGEKQEEDEKKTSGTGDTQSTYGTQGTQGTPQSIDSNVRNMNNSMGSSSFRADWGEQEGGDVKGYGHVLMSQIQLDRINAIKLKQTKIVEVQFKFRAYERQNLLDSLAMDQDHQSEQDRQNQTEHDQEEEHQSQTQQDIFGFHQR